ncbi:tRNA-splicing endonuclease subunit tsp-1 [Lecanosticta acicola]|uniref:tRNA-splicing endonuclease subunit tsp-1 n=1 Tax=Lecanosticta acicola TaxID=111012 RepID=A0AAI9ECM3_9PEZI|nr:tRNA-splicing endonuclease subunit tsp-1 [Lecanosticta acicola]
MTVPHPTKNQSPSALQTFLTNHPPPKSSQHPTDLHHLALQIAHNLHYQHLWTSVRIHRSATHPRPLLSGVPPSRLYIHPDEQIQLLQQQKDHGKTGMPQLEAQREWVLPSHLREKWSLRRLGEVFDSIGHAPRDGEGDEVLEGEGKGKGGSGELSRWRLEMPKRLLLATLDDDSTVVYYIVHDGIVKPRQN